MINFERYYTDQVGGGLPVYRGLERQRGYGGIGNVLGGLFKSAMPLIQSGVKYLGRKAASMGGDIVGDVIQGDNVKKAVKRRFGETKSNVKRDIGSLFLSPPPKIKSRKKKKNMDTNILGKKKDKKVKRKKRVIRRLAKGVRRTLPGPRDIFG